MSSSQETLAPDRDRKTDSVAPALPSEMQDLEVQGMRPDPRLVRRFFKWGAAGAAAAAAIGLLALLGCALGIDRLSAWLPGQISMKANTAIATVSAGIALLLFSLRPDSRWRRLVAAVLAINTVVIAGIVAVEYITGISSTAFDNLLFPEAPGAPHTLNPGRMAPNTSVSVMLIGAAIVLLMSGRRRMQILAQTIAALVAAVALLALFGYTFHIEILYGLGHQMYMSLPVACALLALSVAIGCTTCEHGFVAQTTTRSGGSLMLRRLLPLAIAIPWIVAFLAAQGAHRGWFSGDMDDLLIAATLMATFSALLYFNGRALNRLDAEREATQEVLRRSSEQWKLTFDCMSEGLSYHDVNYNVVASNAAFRNLLGNSEVEGHKCFEAVHGCSAAHQDCPMTRTLQTGRTEESEIYEPRLGKHLLVRTDPVRDSAGQIFRIVHVVEDITARKKAEENIRRFASIVEQSEDAIFSTDMEGRILSWNRAAERIYGYAADEILGQSVSLFTPPETPDDALSVLACTARGERLEGEERIRVRKDGSRFFALLTVSPLRDLNGKMVGASGIVRDITDKKRVEQEVQRTRAELNAVVDSMGEGLYQLDTEGRLVFMNAAGERMLGYRLHEVLGRTMHDVIHSRLPDGTSRHLDDCPLTRVLRQGDPFHSDSDWFMRKDGTFMPVEYTSSPLIIDGEPAGAVLSFRDITERRRAEEEQRHLDELERRARREVEAKNVEIEKLNAELETRVQQRTAELEVANRELEAFSYSVSHDLRAPLRSLDGFSHILLDEYHDRLDAEGRDFLTRLRNASQHMGQLIDALLQLSRVSRSDITSRHVDLSEIAQRIAADLQSHSPGRKCIFEIAPDVRVIGDPRLLHAAMQNLLGNAWKFTARRKEAHIEFGVSEQSGARTFFVRDNGAGFDMNYSNKLFGAFQRLHTASEFEGSGIGLATVQRIIRRHGGKVWAEGRPDHGATFYFTLA